MPDSRRPGRACTVALAVVASVATLPGARAEAPPRVSAPQHVQIPSQQSPQAQALPAQSQTPAQAAPLQAMPAQPAPAQSVPPARDAPFTAADIEAATYSGGDLPRGRSALTTKVQVLLDRSGVSPGVIDGYKGGMSMTAISAYERKMGLPVNGIMDHHVWAGLQQFADRPMTQTYIVTEADAEGLVEAIPTDYAEKAKMAHLGYTSVTERLAERFHMDDKFVRFLNPGKTIAPGEVITVMAPAKRLRASVTRIIIDKDAHRVAAYDAKGRLVVDYPATVGSSATPSPSGDHMVVGVAVNPEYTYNPAINFKQGNNDRALRIPPGPNGPVGSVWIDLDRPTYGIHGTPNPSQLFLHQSHGCVRLTNWDAEELAHMVSANNTEVLFLEPGIRIADVTESVTAPPVITGTKPLPRPGSVAAFALAERDSDTDQAQLPDTLETVLPAQVAAAVTTAPDMTPPLEAVNPVPESSIMPTFDAATATDTPATGAAVDPLTRALERAADGPAPNNRQTAPQATVPVQPTPILTLSGE